MGERLAEVDVDGERRYVLARISTSWLGRDPARRSVCFPASISTFLVRAPRIATFYREAANGRE